MTGRNAEPRDDGATGDQSPSALLDRVLARVSPRLGGFVDDFYERMLVRPPLAQVIGWLRPHELAHLRERQAEHLRMLLSSGVDDRRLRERGREIGRIHAMVGVEIDWYVDALADHRREVLGAVEALCDSADYFAARTVLGERFMNDLQGVLLGYRDLDNAQSRVMLAVTRAVSEARTVVDLTRGTLEALACLDGLAVGFFGRVDAEGTLLFEIGAGDGLDDFAARASATGPPLITTDHGQPSGQGPAGRAWRTGVLQRCDSYMTDPSTEPWHDLGERSGWRSSVAVPLADRRGETRALLSLYARWPGYFASQSTTTMLLQVKQSLETALSDLGERPTLASGLSRYTDRRTHLSRLAGGEVEMLFQPVISLPDGRLSKLEALARLRGHGRLVSPAEFLPAFGHDELFALFEIGLDQSLDALRAWESAGLRTDVSVNLPVGSVEDERYVRVVAQLLAKYDIEPQRLTLELLETGFVDREMQKRRRSIDDFKDLGVRLAQDDLGSGYSSLLRLRHFAFDDVKIDQSLVRGTELAPGAALHFISPINDIAHSLGLTVVIEGLENRGLIEAAVQLGVDEGQGYAIARPMPLGDVAGWARDFHLDLDPRRPRTSLGALAGHVAWEQRVSSWGEHVGRESLLDLGACPLTAYVHDRVRGAEPAHEAVHLAAVDHRGSVGHRASWERLAALVTPAEGG